MQNKKKQMIFYMHAGSKNHGCEAIAVSTMKLLMDENKTKDNDIVFVTNNESEDMEYGLGRLRDRGECDIVEERHIARHKLTHVMYYVYRKITKDAESFFRYRYRDVLNRLSGDDNIAVSIGGDNYCYPEMIKDLVLSHNVFKKKNMKTYLMGCSVEPDSVEGLRDDLNRYDHIIARESITYEGLIAGGIDKEKLSLCPDPAFALNTDEVELPGIFKETDVIGINVSPMVQGKESSPGMTMKNYRELIKYILDNTSYGIALVPHVVWNSNDDRKPLKDLYDEFKGYKSDSDSAAGSNRVVLIEDMSASKLKGIISKCRFFIGARTHSTIAAYSSCVPTLVIGYSVKSRGIARDLFGTDENYVIPVWGLKKEDDLLSGFKWIMSKEDEIRDRLSEVMPEYIKRASGNVKYFV